MNDHFPFRGVNKVGSHARLGGTSLVRVAVVMIALEEFPANIDAWLPCFPTVGTYSGSGEAVKLEFIDTVGFDDGARGTYSDGEELCR